MPAHAQDSDVDLPPRLRTLNPGLPRWSDRQHPLITWLSALALIAYANSSSTQEVRPGATNPIQTPDQRLLFADHRVMLLGEATSGMIATEMHRNRDASDLVGPTRLARLPDVSIVAKMTNGRIISDGTNTRRGEDVAIASFHNGSQAGRLRVDLITGSQPDPSLQSNLEIWPPRLHQSETGYDTASPFYYGWLSFDIDVGELSTTTDDQDFAQDEVVVCYQAQAPGQSRGKDAWTLAVLDYTYVEDDGAVLITSADSRRVDHDAHPHWYPGSSVSCVAADIDGDGADEVVLAYAEVKDTKDHGSVLVEVFEYSNGGPSATRLEPIGSPVVLTPLANSSAPHAENPNVAGSLDLAAGDFNGDGRDDIAVAFAVWQGPSGAEADTRPGGKSWLPNVHILTGDDKARLQHRSTYAAPQQIADVIRVQVAPGLFEYDAKAAAGPLDFNRRQLGLVFNNGSRSKDFHAHILSVSDDLHSIKHKTSTVFSSWADPAFDNLRFSVTAGGFAGAADTKNPLWSLVVLNHMTNGSADYGRLLYAVRELHYLKAGLDGNLSHRRYLPGEEISNAWPLQQTLLGVTAWDRDGASLQLGSPLHIAVEQLTTAQHVIHEPPKHAYWWPPSATKASDGQIINVSRTENLNIELRDSRSVAYSTKHTHKTDWTIGGSLEFSAKNTATVGGDLEIAKAEESVTVEDKLKVQYSYNEKSEGYSEKFRDHTITTEGKTDADDLIRAQVFPLDVWRYPITGILLDNDLNPFFEFVIPGGDGRQRVVSGGGLSLEWYQPTHENGNVLSYPVLGSSFTPEDCCAKFQFASAAGELEAAIPFLDNHVENIGGTSATIDLRFSEKAGSGTSKSYTHSLKESNDFSISFKTTAQFAGTKEKFNGGAGFNLNNNNSWSDVDTANNATNSSTGFKLSKPAIDFNQSYNFAPVFYIAQDGTTKVTHAVDVESSVGSFWRDIYGQKPDPALNLPRRFSVVGSKLTVNERADAKKIRGFFLHRAELSPTGDYPLLAGAANDGERVRVEVRVYNYAIAKGFSNMGIAFEAVQYDEASNREVGERKPIDCGVGSVTRLTLTPRETKRAVCIWDTSGFGPAIPGAIQGYRIYVALDPENQIDELYDGTRGPGQNNEGWGEVAVANPAGRRTSLSRLQAASGPDGADVHAWDDALSLPGR